MTRTLKLPNKLYLFHFSFFLIVPQVIFAPGFIMDVYIRDRVESFSLVASLVVATILVPVFRMRLELQLIAFLGVFPVAVNYLIAGSDYAFNALIICLLLFLLFVLAFYSASFLPNIRLPKPIFNRRTGKLLMGISCSVILLAYVLQAPFNFNLYAFYDSRFEGRDASAFLKYFAVTLGSFGVAWAFCVEGVPRIVKLSIAVLIAVLLFLTFGVRNTFFIVFLYFLYILARNDKKFIQMLVFGYVVLCAVIYVFPTSIASVVSSAFIRRTMIVPGYWPEKAIYMGSNNLIDQGYPLSMQVGAYFIGEGHNANMNPFVTAFLEFGSFLSAIVACVAGLVFGYLVKLNRVFGSGVTIGFGLSIIYSSLRFQSWLLSGGLIFSLLYVTMVYRREVPVSKH